MSDTHKVKLGLSDEATSGSALVGSAFAGQSAAAQLCIRLQHQYKLSMCLHAM